MMATRILTGHSIAWVTSASDMIRLDASTDDNETINVMAFSNVESMGSAPNQWIRIGVAEITVEIVDEKQMVVNTVAALRTEQQSVRAEAEKRATDIDRQINELLAITNEVRP